MPQLRELLHFEKLSRAELAPGGGFIAANGPSGVRIWRLDPGKQPQSRDLITGRESILGFLSSRPAKAPACHSRRRTG